MVKENDRIELITTSDPYTNLSSGDKGTVTGIDTIPAGIAGSTKIQINVDWDTGSNLSLIKGEDQYKTITEE